MKKNFKELIGKEIIIDSLILEDDLQSHRKIRGILKNILVQPGIYFLFIDEYNPVTNKFDIVNKVYDNTKFNDWNPVAEDKTDIKDVLAQAKDALQPGDDGYVDLLTYAQTNNDRMYEEYDRFLKQKAQFEIDKMRAREANNIPTPEEDAPQLNWFARQSLKMSPNFKVGLMVIGLFLIMSAVISFIGGPVDTVTYGAVGGTPVMSSKSFDPVHIADITNESASLWVNQSR